MHLLYQRGPRAAVPVSVAERAEAAVPAGHHDPVIAGEHREPVPRTHLHTSLQLATQLSHDTSKGSSILTMIYKLDACMQNPPW